MSTPDYGDIKIGKDAVNQAKAMLVEAAEQQQLELLAQVEPLSADEIEDARASLGAGAGLVTVLREARKARTGRPLGVRNKRTEDFAKYIAQFGRDPAITMMEIQSTSTEELVARSRLVDTPKRQMSYADAASLRIRCAEALLPYIHSKRPIAVDTTIRGIMVVEEVSQALGAVIENDGEPLGQLAIQEGGDEG
jgi:hypothetical protein